MYAPDQPAPVSKTALGAGWGLSVLLVAAFVLSAVGKFTMGQDVVEGMGKLGWSPNLALGLGLLEVTCAALYLLPRTAVLGAVLLTGYLGGAIATHIRVGDLVFPHIILGLLLWFALYLRDPRVRVLLPLRSRPSAGSAAGMPVVLSLLCWLVAVVGVLALLVALRPGEFRVVRSATIAAPPADVFAQVNDFHNWEAWSPWAKLDPAAKNSFDGPSSGTGAVFSWDGNKDVGAGRMAITESRPHELVRIKLDFVRPFESTCTTEYTLKPEGNGTAITWSMFGVNDYFSKAFCMFMDMDKMVGKDFEKGLAQMKAVTEAKAGK